MNTRKNLIRKARRIVVKVGTSTLAYRTGKLNLSRIEMLVRQLADLQNRGKEVLLVTSGAVGAGMGRLGSATGPATLPEKQAMAAIGQSILMQIYQKFFSEYGHIIAQLLLTREDFEARQRYMHSKNTLRTLLSLKVIPVINENDTVVVDEIKFGDNDTLAALVASLAEADLLVILTDIDGLCTADPHETPGAPIIPVVESITPSIEAMCGYTGSVLGSGGMRTKIQAATIAVNSGCAMLIVNGSQPQVLTRIFDEEEMGTLFVPKKNPLQRRKQWIAFHRSVQGSIVVDDGAKSALVRQNRSLLPGGIVSVDSEFSAGDPVRVLDGEGVEFARGIANYSSADIGRIKGLRTSQIEKVLGQKFYDEVIHRDNLIIL